MTEENMARLGYAPEFLSEYLAISFSNFEYKDDGNFNFWLLVEQSLENSGILSQVSW